MMTRRWPVFAAWFALLAAAGLTSWLLIRSHGTGPATSAAGQRRQQADYLLHSATMTRFADDGQRRYVINAQEITHLPRTDVAILAQIQLDYFPASGTSWHLRADRGHLDQHGDRLELSGKVHAHQVGIADPIRFDTRTLTVLLPDESLHTAAKVILHQGHRETRGTGLAGNLQNGTLSLLKDVTSRYVP